MNINALKFKRRRKSFFPIQFIKTILLVALTVALITTNTRTNNSEITVQAAFYVTKPRLQNDECNFKYYRKYTLLLDYRSNYLSKKCPCRQDFLASPNPVKMVHADITDDGYFDGENDEDDYYLKLFNEEDDDDYDDDFFNYDLAKKNDTIIDNDDEDDDTSEDYYAKLFEEELQSSKDGDKYDHNFEEGDEGIMANLTEDEVVKDFRYETKQEVTTGNMRKKKELDSIRAASKRLYQKDRLDRYQKRQVRSQEIKRRKIQQKAKSMTLKALSLKKEPIEIINDTPSISVDKKKGLLSLQDSYEKAVALHLRLLETLSAMEQKSIREAKALIVPQEAEMAKYTFQRYYENNSTAKEVAGQISSSQLIIPQRIAFFRRKEQQQRELISLMSLYKHPNIKNINAISDAIKSNFETVGLSDLLTIVRIRGNVETIGITDGEYASLSKLKRRESIVNLLKHSLLSENLY